MNPYPRTYSTNPLSPGVPRSEPGVTIEMSSKRSTDCLAAEPLIKVREAALALHLSPEHVYRLCRPGGPIVAIRIRGIVRIVKSSLDDYVRGVHGSEDRGTKP